ncbi:MAG: MEDS domain-containing protein [Candidatus Omnitrophica bacterium]|nr:MEDS domain-containing protein [Candidatus Omnitrophota bacterium]
MPVTSQAPDFDFLHQVSPGRHFYQFFKRSEDYFRVAIPYFLSGLKKGEACLWLISSRMGNCGEIRKVFSSLVSDFDGLCQSGQLQILLAEEWYLTDGHFDEARALENASQYLQKIKSEGYAAIRGAGDAWAVPQRDWPGLMKYEKKVSALIHTENVTALCAYPILECTPTETRSILNCHDDVLVGHF